MVSESPVTRPLAGRIAVVTGAARGIGRATAVALSRAGADVAGIDIAGPVSDILEVEPASLDDLSQTGRLVVSAGGRWSQYVADQRNIDEIRRAAEDIVAHWGGVDIVHANAPMSPRWSFSWHPTRRGRSAAPRSRPPAATART